MIAVAATQRCSVVSGMKRRVGNNLQTACRVPKDAQRPLVSRIRVNPVCMYISHFALISRVYYAPING